MGKEHVDNPGRCLQQLGVRTGSGFFQKLFECLAKYSPAKSILSGHHPKRPFCVGG